MELEIKGNVYQFKASFGFLKEANKTAQRKVDGTDIKKDVGATLLVGSLIDKDPIALVDTLYFLNIGMTPRVKKTDLEAYLEDESTDIDVLFDDVINFLSKSNLTKKMVTDLMDQVEKMKTEMQNQ